MPIGRRRSSGLTRPKSLHRVLDCSCYLEVPDVHPDLVSVAPGTLQLCVPCDAMLPDVCVCVMHRDKVG